MISDYILLKQQEQRANEFVQAATRQAMLKQLCPPVLRQVLARMIGNSCVAFGKRLLTYGEANTRNLPEPSV